MPGDQDVKYVKVQHLHCLAFRYHNQPVSPPPVRQLLATARRPGPGPSRTRKARPRRHSGRIIHPLCPFPPARTRSDRSCRQSRHPRVRPSRAKPRTCWYRRLPFNPGCPSRINKQCLGYPRRTREPASAHHTMHVGPRWGSRPGQTARPSPTTRPRPIPPARLFLRRASDKRAISRANVRRPQATATERGDLRAAARPTGIRLCRIECVASARCHALAGMLTRGFRGLCVAAAGAGLAVLCTCGSRPPSIAARAGTAPGVGSAIPRLRVARLDGSWALGCTTREITVILG